MIRTRMHINYMAAIKRDSGMTNLEAVTGIEGLRFEKEDLANMVEEMPGFRVVMATMLQENRR